MQSSRSKSSASGLESCGDLVVGEGGALLDGDSLSSSTAYSASQPDERLATDMGGQVRAAAELTAVEAPASRTSGCRFDRGGWLNGADQRRRSRPGPLRGDRSRIQCHTSHASLHTVHIPKHKLSRWIKTTRAFSSSHVKRMCTGSVSHGLRATSSAQVRQLIDHSPPMTDPAPHFV